MRKATFLAAAPADLVDILTYVTESSGDLAVAQGFVGRLRAQCHRLAGLPGTLGRARPDLRPDVRSVPFGHHVIFFRYAGDVFEIVAIIHASRDIDTLFVDSPG